MTTLYQQVKEDLMTVEDLDDFNIPPPYLSTDSIQQKVKITYRTLL